MNTARMVNFLSFSLFLLLSVNEVEIIPFLADGRVRVEPILTKKMENIYHTFFYTAHCPTNLDLYSVSAGFDGNFVARF
jgi:hypothetical protein